jgi:hypothetical protein
VAAHPTTNLTGERHRRCRRYSPRWPPTRDGPHCGKRPRGAFFPGAAPEPGYRRRPQPGPWGRWPTRRCAAEQHLTTDLPENASHATSVTAAGELRGHKRPQGPPSRGRSSSTTSKSAWRPAAVTSAHRPCQLLHPPWQTNGGPRGLPRVTLDPPAMATREHGDLVAPAPGQARGRLQARTGGSRGGHLREPPALVDRLPDRAFVQREPLRQIGSRLAPPAAAHQVTRAWLAVHQSASPSTPVGAPTVWNPGSFRLALPRPFARGSSPTGPQPAQHRAAPSTRHRAPTSWPPDCPARGRRTSVALRPPHLAGRPPRHGPGLTEALDVLTTELASSWCSGGSLLARFAARNVGHVCVSSHATPRSLHAAAPSRS